MSATLKSACVARRVREGWVSMCRSGLISLYAWALDWPVSSQDWTPVRPNSPGRWRQGLPHYIGNSLAFSHFCMEHNKIHLWRWAYIYPKSSTQGVVDFLRTTVASNKATLNPDFPSAIKTPLSLLTLTGVTTQCWVQAGADEPTNLLRTERREEDTGEANQTEQSGVDLQWGPDGDFLAGLPLAWRELYH